MQLLTEHHEDLELDLLKPDNGQADLLDFWRGTLSPRRLLLLIRGLPASSRFRSKTDPDEALYAAWSVTDYILANLYDATVGPKNKRHPRPDQIIRDRNWNIERQRLLDEQAERNRQRDMMERRQPG